MDTRVAGYALKKFSKREVQFEHPASGMDTCGECKHFLTAEHACKIVRGKIEAEDWCDKFARREKK